MKSIFLIGFAWLCLVVNEERAFAQLEPQDDIRKLLANVAPQFWSPSPGLHDWLLTTKQTNASVRKGQVILKRVFEGHVRAIGLTRDEHQRIQSTLSPLDYQEFLRRWTSQVKEKKDELPSVYRAALTNGLSSEGIEEIRFAWLFEEFKSKGSRVFEHSEAVHLLGLEKAKTREFVGINKDQLSRLSESVTRRLDKLYREEIHELSVEPDEKPVVELLAAFLNESSSE